MEGYIGSTGTFRKRQSTSPAVHSNLCREAITHRLHRPRPTETDQTVARGNYLNIINHVKTETDRAAARGEKERKEEEGRRRGGGEVGEEGESAES